VSLQLTLSKARFLANNYKQALNIIETHKPVLRAVMSDLGLTNTSIFGSWLSEECEYLEQLKQEPDGKDVLKMEYLVLLCKLEPVE